MKTPGHPSQPPLSEPASAPIGLNASPGGTDLPVWRSLEELGGTPAFRAWAEREFAEAVLDPRDEGSRRQFLKLMGASLLLAGVGFPGSGCRRPEEKIFPFSKLAEGYQHGRPRYFATALPLRESAIPLLVKSSDGRPTKIEGNPLHPVHGHRRGEPFPHGGTPAWAQASLLGLYDPDRAQRFTHRGEEVPRETALRFVAELARQTASAGGGGLAVLLERSSSPSRERLLKVLRQRLPAARWFFHESVDDSVAREAAPLATGAPVRPLVSLNAADVILALDWDFLGTEEESIRLVAQFAQRRRATSAPTGMNRLYAVEALMTQTGLNADHRLRLPASQVVRVAAAITAAVLRRSPAVPEAEVLARILARPGPPPGTTPRWCSECANDLLVHRGRSLVWAGQRQPVAVHLIAQALNAALGNLGATVQFRTDPDPAAEGLAALAAALRAGQVETLVILSANPAYTAPVDLEWAEAQKRATTVLRLGAYEDETALASTCHCPAAHYLEAWGDARTGEGTLTPVQPLIQELFGGLTELELLARLGGLATVRPYEVVRETFRELSATTPAPFEEKWKTFLHDGFWPGTAFPVATGVRANWTTLRQSLEELAGTTPPPAPAPDRLEVIFHRDARVDDGRWANNGWLQEFPDPVTKLTWGNAATLSRKTAVALGLRNAQVVEIELHGRRLRAPLFIQPGQADDTVGLALGYGRLRAGRVGNFAGQPVGFNAGGLRTSEAPSVAAGARIKPTAEIHAFACTQEHWSMEGRPIIRECSGAMEGGRTSRTAAASPSLYANELDELKKSAAHQWAMSIDLSACVGCGACVLACQSENNIPIVGPDQVRLGREMHWLRVDRYYVAETTASEGHVATAAEADQWKEQWIDDPRAAALPILCQHCEAAPCENVCPVNATVHDNEGLNLMAYNRCVGTRYCSNNCPYKVRRFNFFDYHKRPLEALYHPSATLQTTRPRDEWELAKLVKNPEVSVRMRGVMEKCTFCLQRLEEAKIARKIQPGAATDTTVPDGVVQTACQQACPAGAIVFGNLADPTSRVAQLRRDPRHYAVLEGLNTRPRVTYLARVRNPNPQMTVQKV